mmetsp:Transcript_21050/g.49933  ORF Transcript_21050/g.49933 Transcript_21050/m.49933 type:complete len:248 (-) Transcript_21050:1287-2030(-)
MESFYVLESFGISSKQFPVDLSTGKIDLTNNERWLKIRASEERAPKKPRSSSRRRLVECPSQSDVLLGRGKVIMYHPGNIVFRHYIDFKLESYTKLRTKKDSVHWTRGVVQSFQKQYDARFLREERIDGTDFMAWVEVPNDVARNKVRIAFRDARSRLAAAGGRSRGGDTTADSKAAGEDSGSRTPTTTTSSSSAFAIRNPRPPPSNPRWCRRLCFCRRPRRAGFWRRERLSGPCSWRRRSAPPPRP